jgi:cellulose synthase (UDP-forming)
VAIIAALLATLSYQLFLFTPAYRGPTWLWVPLLVAEGLVAFQTMGSWWTILAHDDRAESAQVSMWRNRLSVQSSPPPTMDVFITAYGEPPELVRRTMQAARAMSLEHRTIVLDDGRSDVLRDIAREEDVEYQRRDGREHAKAGNVNAALERTDGEFVVILDADFVPESDFLLTILPHLHDSNVAFVQSPQHYQQGTNLVSRGAADAQRVFYELVCPGKNHFNAAFCVGTNVMFRRAALEDLGGIYTGSNSEDIWTSIELHRRGWRSVYVPQVLATGLAPDNVEAYFKQQLRWASGGFEVLFRGRLFRRGNGLTLDQRLQYLFTGTHYLLSVAMLAFMMMPSTYLLFGLSPIKADGWTWVTHYVPFMGMTLLVTWLQSGGFGASAVVASVGASPVHAKAMFATLFKRQATWSVTNRAGGRVVSLGLVMPHVALLVLNVTAITVGLLVMQDVAATLLSATWALLHVLVLGRMILEVFLSSADRDHQSARTDRGADTVIRLPEAGARLSAH